MHRAALLMVAVFASARASPAELPQDIFWPPHKGTLAPIRPRASLPPIEPRSPAALQCSIPYVQVVLLPGERVTVVSPNAPFWRRGLTRFTETCGWVLTTAEASSLSISCQKIELYGEDVLLSTQLTAATAQRFRVSGSRERRNIPLRDHKVALTFRYTVGGFKGFFICEIVASIAPATSATVPIAAAVQTTAAAITAAPAIATTAVGTTTAASFTCRCGIARRSFRIVGGSNTEVSEYSWQAGLVSRYTRDVFCGGTVISDRHILTAAHCTRLFTMRNFQVLLGGYSTAVTSSNEMIMNPVRIIRHPLYNAVTLDNDVALIEVKPLNFTDPRVLVRPVCLPPDRTKQYTNVDAVVSGWGRLYPDGTLPTILQEVTVPIVTNTQCQLVYMTPITNNMICAGALAGGRDACQGDSGGPLVTQNGVNYDLIGVVSFGAGCGDPGVPGVYARITAVQDWIETQIEGSTNCPR